MKTWKVVDAAGNAHTVTGLPYLDPAHPGLVMFLADDDERNPDNQIVAAFFRPASVVAGE